MAFLIEERNMEENKLEGMELTPETEAPKEEKSKFNWNYGAQDEYNKKQRRSESRRGTAVYVLTALLVFALGFAGIGAVALLDSYTHITQTIEKENVIYIRETDSESLSVTEIAGQVKPSVVVVESVGEKNSAGAGFVISADGYIATSNHVVAKSVYYNLYSPPFASGNSKTYSVDYQ